MKASVKFKSGTVNIKAPPPSSSCPTGDVDESRDPLKLLLKENDIIKTWLTALRGTTEHSHLMSVYQRAPCVPVGCTKCNTHCRTMCVSFVFPFKCVAACPAALSVALADTEKQK